MQAAIIGDDGWNFCIVTSKNMFFVLWRSDIEVMYKHILSVPKNW